MPVGQSVDVLNTEIFKTIQETELDDFSKEHVIPIFFRSTKRVQLVKKFHKKLKGFTIDTIEDYLKFLKVIQKGKGE